MLRVKDVIDKLQLKILTDNKSGCELMDNQVSGVYICDLLSWVMSHARKGDIWVTVQIHPNIVAVATLLELSCIIIPEGIEVDKVTLDKAKENKVLLLQSDKDSFFIAGKLKEMGL